MADLTSLGQAVRKNRKRAGLTQIELANRTGVSRNLIGQLESGRLPEIGIRKLTRILHAVGLDLRITTFNLKRPTFEDLLHEEEGESK